MFKKDNYIVTLIVENWDGDNCAKPNYCFKQRDPATYMRPAIDLKGSDNNAHGIMSYDKLKKLKDWRYATPQEIVEYDRLGKPFDVTTLTTEPNYEIY